MLSTIRLFTAILVLIVLSPQTEKSNIILKIFHESGFFTDYIEAKRFTHLLSWLLIFLFLFLALL